LLISAGPARPLQALVRSHPTDCHCARAARLPQAKATWSRVKRAQTMIEVTGVPCGPGPDRISASTEAALARAPTSIEGTTSMSEDDCRKPRTESLWRRCLPHAPRSAKRRRLQDDRAVAADATQSQTEDPRFPEFDPRKWLSNDELERRAVTERPATTTGRMFFVCSSQPDPRVRSKRWLESTPQIATVRVRLCCGKRSLQTRQVKRAQAVNEGT
jgi:hypothetical protein